MDFPWQGLFKGTFATDIKSLQEKMLRVKAFVFDWDGVFNNGFKSSDNTGSPFSEIDSMGTNLLRFSYYLRTQELPVTAIISGERNESSWKLSQREHFHATFYKVPHKILALETLCRHYQLQAAEIAFVYDDVLDLSVAEKVGVRFMIGRRANPILSHYVARHQLADYISDNDGGQHGLREICELTMALQGTASETIQHRIAFSEVYQDYLQLRNQSVTQLFTRGEDGLITLT